MTADQSILSFHEVCLEYKSTAGSIKALEDLDFQVARSEPVVLIGPSGCGKTSTLLLAAGLLKPTTGSVLVDGAFIKQPRFATALILQEYGLLPWKNVYGNVALGLRIRNLPRAEIKERSLAAMEQVGLSQFANNYPEELSGGMRQRLALARALTLDFDLLLMDEPLSALDALLRESLQDTLLKLWQKRKHAQVLVTHSVEEAVFLGRKIAVFSSRPGHIRAWIENPGMGSEDYRSDPAYHSCCRDLREILRTQSEADGVPDA
jgi:NitT/TauT family transport system ATP-binding protein